MKTPEEWSNELTQFGDGLIFPPDGARRFIERIQQDALSDPMAQTLDQHELEMVKDIAENLEYQLQVRTQELAEMREKWHEARKHLRAANKGAERSAKALELSATRFWEMVHSDRRCKERDENQHKTIIWNWLVLSDEDLTHKVGEHITSKELRLLRLLLRAMLGSSLITKPHL